MPERHEIPVVDQTVDAVHHDSASDAWLVFCHGFLSDKTGSYEARCERAVEEGYNAVRFDFRGSGDSEGAFIDQNLSTRIADLRAVIDYFDPDSYALFGSSFGAKVAFHAAIEDDRVEAIGTRAPVTYNRAFEEYHELVTEQGSLRYDDDHAIDARFFEDFVDYPFTAVEADLDVPVAVFHGTDDESVPLAHSLEAAGLLKTDVLLQTYPGEGHRFSREAETRMRRQLFDWLGTV